MYSHHFICKDQQKNIYKTLYHLLNIVQVPILQPNLNFEWILWVLQVGGWGLHGMDFWYYIVTG